MCPLWMHQFFSAEWEQEMEMNFPYFQRSVHGHSPQSLGYGQAFGGYWGVFIYSWADLWDFPLNFIAPVAFLWFFWSRKTSFL